MPCPSCGTRHDVSECENLALKTNLSEGSAVDSPGEEDALETELPTQSTPKDPARSRLIEFPGAARASVPVWRKEIAERVREAQERKAREAAADTGDLATPQLELLPQTEPAPINPIVAAALKRIERAHGDAARTASHSGRPMAAVAYARGYEPIVEPSTHSAAAVFTAPPISEVLTAETPVEEIEPARMPTLVVVPSPPPLPVEQRIETRAPRKIISDDVNNPALNYLDSVPTSLRVEPPTNPAGVGRRLGSGIFDLLLLALLYFPIAVSLELMKGDWRNPQVIGLAVATFVILGFFYFTVATGLTGRTFGMRLFGLRIVDVRTGLIPTGSQSASRSLLYLFSLLSAGLLFVGALLDSDHRTPHERFSRTAVVKA